MIEGLDVRDSNVRRLDQSRVGAILTGDVEALKGGPPVRAMLIQNTNPLAVAPNQEKVRRGFSRDDLFTCVHEQFMTDTRAMPTSSCPPRCSGTRRPLHRWRPSAPAIRPQGGRLARGLPLQSRGDHRARSTRRRRASGILDVATRDHDWTLRESGYGDLATLEKERWLDLQPPFEESHFLSGFGFPDGKFRFKRTGRVRLSPNDGMRGPWRAMPSLPDYWPINEAADEDHPFKAGNLSGPKFSQFHLHSDAHLAHAEQRPEVLISPSDAATLGLCKASRATGERTWPDALACPHSRSGEAGRPGE